MIRKINLAIMVLFFFFFSDCKKEEDINSALQLKNMYIVDISKDTDWTYWVVGKEGEYIFIKEQNARPKTIFYKPTKDGQGYPIYLDDYGFPEKVVIEGYIFVFGNFSGYYVDITVVNPKGQIEVLRNIKTSVNWDNNSSKGANDTQAWSDVIRWSGRAISTVSCGIGIATTIGTAGIGFPLTIIGCGATLVGIVTEFLPEDYEILGFSATTVGTFATVVGCINNAGLTCSLGLISLGTKVVSAGVKIIEDNPTLLQNIPIRVNLFLTKENIALLASQGLTIYRGLNPPDITGNYYLSNWCNLSTGHRYIDYSYRFSNLTSDLRLDVEYSGTSSTATSYRGLIAGTNTLYSLFCEVNEVDENNGHIVKIKIATIYSGILLATGLQNFQMGFIVIAKENDIDNAYMNVGESRVIYEADYLAQKVSTFPYISKKSNLLLKSFVMKD
jgi:hypothetical protein